MGVERASKEETWTVTAVSEGFGTALSREHITEQLRKELAEAEILLVPREGFREHKGPLFPVGTEELLQLFRDKAPSNRVDIAIEGSQYHELALHSDVLTIVTLVCKATALPVIVGVLTEFIKRRIWKPKDDRVVRAEIIVTSAQGANSQSARISYEGPGGADFSKAMAEAAAALREGRTEGGVQLDVPPVPQLAPANEEKKQGF